MPTNTPEFESLMETHTPEIFAYLWRLMGDGHDAEDCLQETFMRAYRAYDRFQGQADAGRASHPRAWLYTIATNVARTELRRRSRRLSQTGPLDAQLPVSSADPARQAEDRIKLAQIRAAVDALPPRQKAALLLRKYQSLSYHEIAAVLDCTETAARAHVYQALKKLRREFGR